ncbi:MAG TPA: hypothetical protein VIH56_03055 [Candidatus Acidoferrales bacterium]
MAPRKLVWLFIFVVGTLPVVFSTAPPGLFKLESGILSGAFLCAAWHASLVCVADWAYRED